MYGVAVIMLIGVLHDGQIDFSEAVILVTSYFIYIASTYFCFGETIVDNNTFVFCCSDVFQ